MPLKTNKHCRNTAEPEDGTRINVMRYWPRGVAKTTVDEWLPALAPSKELLASYKAEEAAPLFAPADEQDLWSRYVVSYRREMSEQAELIEGLRERHSKGEVITLLCACHDEHRCHRSLLAGMIGGEDATAGK